MNRTFEVYLQERKDFQLAYDRLLQFASDGAFAREIVHAKEVFFSRLGRTHEMKEDLYDSASQSFLEWYLTEYHTKAFGKTPLTIYLTLGLGTPQERARLESIHFHPWSVFEVKQILKDRVVVHDLLFDRSRSIVYDLESTEARVWKVKLGQIFQARLFKLMNEDQYFFTHVWLHVAPDDQTLKRICRDRSMLWSEHKDFLLSSFEAAVRSYSIQSQIHLSRAANWLYAELEKKYLREAERA